MSAQLLVNSATVTFFIPIIMNELLVLHNKENTVEGIQEKVIVLLNQNRILQVIVCDDDVELNSFIRCGFKLDGYDTHKASSAEECINILEEKNGIIDAIVVDGKIASERSTMLILNAKKRYSNVKIFVLANRGLSEEKTRIMDYGADEFALKPLSLESVVNKVNKMLLTSAPMQ